MDEGRQAEGGKGGKLLSEVNPSKGPCLGSIKVWKPFLLRLFDLKTSGCQHSLSSLDKNAVVPFVDHVAPMKAWIDPSPCPH